MVTDTSRVTVERVGRRHYEINLRRRDDTLVRVAVETSDGAAQRAAARVVSAITDGEAWALKLLDVSAGELRA